jgi:hypothetical protein
MIVLSIHNLWVLRSNDVPVGSYWRDALCRFHERDGARGVNIEKHKNRELTRKIRPSRNEE